MCSTPVSLDVRAKHGGGAGSPAAAKAVRPILANLPRAKRFWRQGEPFVWASGAALSAVLLATLLLVAVVMVNGLGVFWPAAIVEATFDDGKVVLGQWMRAETNPDTRAESVQLKTANRELDPQRMDFHWYPTQSIRELALPDDVYVLERVENGNFYGFLTDLDGPVGNALRGVPGAANAASVGSPGTPRRAFPTVNPADKLDSAFQEALVEIRRRRAGDIAPLASRLLALNYDLQQNREEILKLEYWRKRDGMSGAPVVPAAEARLESRLAELRDEESQIRFASDRLVAQKGKLEANLRKNVAHFRTASGQIEAIPLVDVLRAYQPNSMSFGAKLRHYVAKVWEMLCTTNP